MLLIFQSDELRSRCLRRCHWLAIFAIRKIQDFPINFLKILLTEIKPQRHANEIKSKI